MGILMVLIVLDIRIILDTVIVIVIDRAVLFGFEVGSSVFQCSSLFK